MISCQSNKKISGNIQDHNIYQNKAEDERSQVRTNGNFRITSQQHNIEDESSGFH